LIRGDFFAFCFVFAAFPPAGPSDSLSDDSFLRELQVAPHMMAVGKRWRTYPIPEPSSESGAQFHTIQVYVSAQTDYFYIRPFASHKAASLIIDNTAVESGHESQVRNFRLIVLLFVRYDFFFGIFLYHDTLI
jgi:hypothetical protein